MRCALYTVHSTLCTVHCALYTVHCTLCTVHYTRYTVLCALCTIPGTLDSVHCALYTVHCTLCTVHYTRYTVLCALYTVHCTLCTIHGTLYSVHYTRYTVLSALCTMHGTLYSVHCALCTIHGTLYSVHYTRYAVLCALYTVHCTLCTIHGTLYSVHCAPYTQLDDLRQPGVFLCLVKPTQNGGLKPTSWNSIPRVFFRFAPTGKVEKTSFQGKWTTFVNPPFCTACKGPGKMLVLNRPRGIRSQGCFFVSSRWENSTKRVFNPIGRTSSSRRFPLLGKAHPKWWYETDLVEFDPKGAFSFRPDGECRKNEFWTQLDDLRQPGVFRCLVKPTQNGGMKPTSWNSIPRVLFRFAPMGISTKRVLNAIGRPSSTRSFALLGKAHRKWWYETDTV